MKSRISSVIGLGLVVAGCSSVPTGVLPAASLSESLPSAEILVAWNELVLATAEVEDGFLTLKGLRTAAMMHLAAHDALNAVDRRYATYLPALGGDTGDALAATARALHDVALSQYPDQKERFAVEKARWLGEVSTGRARDQGEEIGRVAAARVLHARDGDGWNNQAEYQWHPMGPGVYAEFAEHSGTPEGFVFGAGWATAEPFFLESPGQFRSPEPPAISSPEYLKAYNEVKQVGRYESAARTVDQTHLALWWKDFAENSHNRLARQLVVEEGLGLWPAARMFALLNTSLYDAYLSVFENKFHFNHWRPYTAIRWAANDGNPETEPDSDWNNTHRHTYPFPSYPSAHGSACAAAMTALEDTFGEDRAISMTTTEVDVAGPFSGKMTMNPSTRTFESFSAAAWECSISRVYLGIHFRYDSEAGIGLGTQIGRFAVENYLRPEGG